MRILYIFPHPDDESFGPAPAMARQLGQGHQVHLLTLTRGGATKERHRFGFSVEEMGRVRHREMLEVEKALGLSSLQVLDFPDSGLKEVDPLELEEAILESVGRIRPHVLVTYAVHGISGFHDHLVAHAVVKRVYCELRRGGGEPTPGRLALFTVSEAADLGGGPHRLQASSEDEIDCRVIPSQGEMEVGRRALACYETYARVIEEARPLDRLGGEVCFEFFQEAYEPPLSELTDRL